MVSWSDLALQGLIAFAVTLAAVPVARRVALRLGITDRPAPGKMHKRPTPYLGGLAIGVGAIAAAIAVTSGRHGWTRQGAAILAGGIVIAVVGLVDDLRNLSPAVRLVVESAAATLVVAAGVHVQLLGNPIDGVITVVWIVVLTNSFNLLDNMDGAAGTVGSITAIALVIASGLEGQIIVSGLGAVIAGACLGFLPYNWHPARIFMGDAGSLFLGYLLSVLAIALRFPTGRFPSLVAVVLLAGPCVFDTTLVVLSRRSAGRPISVGGTDHTSHRLNRLGLRIPVVATVLALGTTAMTSLGVATGRGAVHPAVSIALVAIVGIVSLNLLLRMPVYELGAGRPTDKP